MAQEKVLLELITEFRSRHHQLPPSDAELAAFLATEITKIVPKAQAQLVVAALQCVESSLRRQKIDEVVISLQDGVLEVDCGTDVQRGPIGDAFIELAKGLIA